MALPALPLSSAALALLTFTAASAANVEGPAHTAETFQKIEKW